ncbi:MAG: hypothetical protein DI547_10850 [Sphingobium sp.]|nr:MAG: hypothetical protein DI547_10850 [Sphingobium sp.]
MVLRGCIAGCLGALLLPFAAAAQQAPAPDPDDPPAVVRSGVDKADRITIPIQIAGTGPFDFIIDTGSQRTVISRELADRLALAPATDVKVLSIAGMSDARTVTVPQLSFGSSVMAPVQAPVFAADHLGGAGLLGLDGLHRKRLVLDFRTGRMQITPSSKSRPAIPPGDHTVVVEGRMKEGQLILMDSNADKVRVRIMLDTGSEYSIGNYALLRALQKRDPGTIVHDTVITGVTGEEISGQWGRLRIVRMGGMTMRNLPVVFADAAPFALLGLQDKPALMLGVNALRGFDRVAIDFGRKRVDFLMPDQSSLAGARFASLD